MIHDLKRRVALHPDDAGARYALAEALFGEGRAEAAIDQLERALALDPDHGDARRLLARAYVGEGRLVPAERALEEAVKRRPRDAGARDELAALLAQGGRLDDAIVHLEEAVRADPDCVPRRVLVADLARRRGLFARARRHLDHAARLAPDDVAVADRRRDLAMEAGDAAAPLPSPILRGREFLLGRTRSALLTPPFRGAGGAVAEAAARIRAGDVRGAKRALVTAPPGSASIAIDLLRAEILLLEGDLARAEHAFRRAAEQRPDLSLASSRLAEILSASGRHADAAACLASLVERSPEDADALEQLGEALLAAGRREEAARRLRDALARRPDGALAARIAAIERPAAPPADERVPGRIGALGWNATGGVVSPLEAAAVPGKGELVFTGNVGKVGRDAAKVAFSCVKARADTLGVADRIERCDLHLHFVDTANEKDGPSAGLALALAGISALTGRPLRPRLAATGELTPHGAVRPVGGLHEKLVAAYLADVEAVIVPRNNLFDVRTLPGEVVGRLEIVYVDALTEALARALGGQGGQ